jgi:hypothetical protein
MAFVWTWIGLDDAYVDNAPKPECWFGVARLTDMDTDSTDEIASKIWRFFRFEWTMEVEIDGWLRGSFQQNTIGCNLAGGWYLRRVTLCQLASYYEVEKLIVRPLSEKFHDLMNSSIRWPAKQAETYPRDHESSNRR